VRMKTQEDLDIARERLRRRDSESLVSFLISLTAGSGPVVEQVRTFIGGDDLADTVESVRRRITGLKISSEYEHRHSYGREIGMQLNFIVDSIERLVLPVDAQAAFELLAALIEADGVAMENCGEHDWPVACAYQRATKVLAEAAKSMPRPQVENRITTLVADDAYGMREGLAAIVPGE
jgi:hypothetical protein